MKSPLADFDNATLTAAHGSITESLRAATEAGDAEAMATFTRAGWLLVWEMHTRRLVDDAVLMAVSAHTLATGACAS